MSKKFFGDGTKIYGVLYGAPMFPIQHKRYWMNYAFGHFAMKNMPKEFSEKVKGITTSINNNFSDKIIIPLGPSTTPGLVSEPDVIEEIANLLFTEFSQILDNNYKVVWSIGEMDKEPILLKQATRTQKTPTLHQLNPYDVVIRVGRKLDSIKEPGIYKV